jgi:hypothetical protein
MDDQVTLSMGMKVCVLRSNFHHIRLDGPQRSTQMLLVRKALLISRKLTVMLEAILVSDSLIRGAVIFSHGTAFGVIIDPVPEYAAKSNLSDPGQAATFKSLIW